jgi:hypothetical protein
VDGWMRRLTQAEAIYRQTPRSKGVANRARNRLRGRPEPTGPGPFQPRFAP